MSINVLEKAFTSTEASEFIAIRGGFNISVDYTTGAGVGSIDLQRSFDKGATWKTTDTILSDTEKNGLAIENLLWRLDCTYTSGTITARISQ